MKGVIIFSPADDIAFVWTNDELKAHFCAIAQSRGQNGKIGDELDQNFLLQFLSPIFASQKSLASNLHDSYRSIVCQNGFLFSFMQFDNHVYLAINGDESESESYLRRKLTSLHRIISMLLGPVVKELKPAQSSQRAERWDLIGRLLDSWCHLYQSEQSFLVEAVERLRVNEDLVARSVQLLNDAMNQMKAVNKQLVHSMLVVHTKLLASTSSPQAAPLDPSDTIMLILLANFFFPPHLDPDQASVSGQPDDPPAAQLIPDQVSLSDQPACLPTDSSYHVPATQHLLSSPTSLLGGLASVPSKSADNAANTDLRSSGVGGVEGASMAEPCSESAQFSTQDVAQASQDCHQVLEDRVTRNFSIEDSIASLASGVTSESSGSLAVTNENERVGFSDAIGHANSGNVPNLEIIKDAASNVQRPFLNGSDSCVNGPESSITDAESSANYQQLSSNGPDSSGNFPESSVNGPKSSADGHESSENVKKLSKNVNDLFSNNAKASNMIASQSPSENIPESFEDLSSSNVVLSAAETVADPSMPIVPSNSSLFDVTSLASVQTSEEVSIAGSVAESLSTGHDAVDSRADLDGWVVVKDGLACRSVVMFLSQGSARGAQGSVRNVQSHTRRHRPHMVQCVHVLPGVTLVLISQIQHVRHSDALLRILDITGSLLGEDELKLSSRSDVRDILDKCVKTLSDVPKLYGVCTECLLSFF